MPLSLEAPAGDDETTGSGPLAPVAAREDHAALAGTVGRQPLLLDPAHR
jgi:hypothetical protein